MLEHLRDFSRRARGLTPPQWAAIVPFGVFCFVFPFAVLLLSLDLMPFGMEWMSSLLLAMLGISAWAWLWLNLGVKGLLLGTLVFAFGVLLEYAGVSTGVPFGRYMYTGVLVPGLPGGVPLAIGFAWLFIVVGGLFAARAIVMETRAARALPWVASLLGALLAVGLDLLLEPVAYHVKDYWEWEDAGPVSYYGVPWSNFAAWFAASLALNLLLSSFTPRSRGKWTWLPVTLYAMNVVLFGVVNIAHSMWLPGVVATLLLGGLLVWRVSNASETEPRGQGAQSTQQGSS